MSSGSFARFLARSLDVLEAEAPAAYRLILEKLGERRVAIEIDGERVAVASVQGRLLMSRTVGPASAEARASREVLVRLLEGESDLTQAILEEEIGLRGALEDLVAFYEGLLVYFLGAARCPSFPKLLDRFLDGSERGGERPLLH